METEIFNFIYTTALRDAVMRKAYTGDRKKLLENDEARTATKNYIDAVLAGKHPDFYKTAEEVEDKFGDGFTFGNTQKLINMCVKYAYIATYNNADLRENFRECHCPMDGIMVEEVIKKIVDRGDEEFLGKDYTRGWRGFLRQPWSRIKKDNNQQYKLFQKVVKKLAEDEKLTRIEFDYRYWNKEDAAE